MFSAVRRVSVIAVLLGVLLPAHAEAIPRRERIETGRVVWVTDGDTLHVEIDGRKEKVRLIGIDAPEMSDGRKEWRDLARSASRYVRSALKGRTVILSADPRQRDRDDYGRLLRYVVVEGKNFNEELVRLGYARVYRRFDFELKGDFLAAEADAKRERLRLWSLPPGPVRE